MNRIAAIDLGTTKVVAIVGEKTPHGCKVIAYSESPSQGVMRGEVVNIQNVLDSMMPCIEDIQEKIGEKISSVYVGIAGQHIRSLAECNMVNRENHNVEITREEIQRLEQNMYSSLVEPGEEILHVIPQCYHIDDILGQRDPVGMMGKRIEANYRLFIGRTTSAVHTKRCVERAGLKMEKLILEPLASAKAVLKEDEMELGVAMIDIGGGTTDLLVYHDNVIRHTAVIPFGGNSITDDIIHGCGISKRYAEQMKIQYGSCYSDLAPANKTVIVPGIGGREPREVSFKTLSNIIEARISEIMDAVLYRIQDSGYADKLQAGIVLTGGGALMSHLVQYVKFKTGYEARIAKPSSLVDGSCPEVYRPAYSCAVGLLLKGIEYQKAIKESPSVEGASILDWLHIFKRETVKSDAPPKVPKKQVPKVKAPPVPKEPSETLFGRIDKFLTNLDNDV